MRILLLLALAVSAAAQVPDKFTNLQVFPKDIAKQELINTMRGYSFSLGVRCVHCHVAKPDSPQDVSDFASDAKEAKKTTRTMLRMVEAMNRDYIAKVEPVTSNRVNCITCHHGLAKPQTLQAALEEELDKKDLASAIALYQKLRKSYYGGAQYDFSETSLNILAENLMAKRKTKEAAAFMELNAENSQITGWGRGLLAMAHRANGETDKAIADFQKLVDMNPNDSWAKQQLEALKKK